MAKVNLSAPWTTLYRQFQAFFRRDPGVKVVFEEGEIPSLKLYVEDQAKASALTMLLPSYVDFGRIVMRITVIPANANGAANGASDEDTVSSIKSALKGNPIVSEIVETISEFVPGKFCYVVFKKEVVQFFNDNLRDIHGLTSTLYQDLAEKIFLPHAEICYCTEADGKLGMPLGEWP